MCESVPVAQSAGEDQGRPWPEKTEREGKTNTGNMATDRTLLESGAELPRGHLWDCADPPPPEVIKWSLTPQQLFTKAGSLEGVSKQKHLRSGRGHEL